jgi:hypothetical protein
VLHSVKYSSLGSHWQHEYSQYTAFESSNFPGRIKSESSDKGSLDIVVTALAPEAASDMSAFAKPPNSERRPVCRVATPPRPLSSNQPVFTGGNHQAILGFVVGIDGRPHNFQTIDSTDRNYASAVQSVVQTWTFTPSTCQGEAIPAWFEVNMTNMSR